MNETEWQRQVCQLLDTLGWTWVHFPKVRTARKIRGRMVYRWRTVYEGPGGKGLPDLMAWRERLIFLELKAKGGRLEPHQRLRAMQLGRAKVEVHCFRPADLMELRDLLSRRREDFTPTLDQQMNVSRTAEAAPEGTAS